MRDQVRASANISIYSEDRSGRLAAQASAMPRLPDAVTDAIRFVRRDRHTALTTAAILAVGLGANIAIFAVAYGVMLRPLPLDDPKRVVVMWERAPAQATSVWEVSYRDFRDWQTQNTSFVKVAATGSINWSLSLIQLDGPVSLAFAAVSGTFFDVLGARPQLGRTLAEMDDLRTSARVAVISHATWRDHFGSRADIIGSRVMIDDGPAAAPVTIVGVMPAAFDYPRGASFWLPIVPTLARLSPGAGFDMLEARGLGILYVVGRLRPNVTVTQARADIDVIVDRLTRTSDVGAGRSSVVTPLNEQIFGQAGTALRLLIWGGGVVMLLTCANATALLLARFARDRRSLFIRHALGAGRSHLLRQSLSEGTALAMTALAGGLALAVWIVRLATRFAPETVPRVNEVALASPVVAAYALITSVTVALVCGVLPLGIVLGRTGIERSSVETTDTRTATLPIRNGLVVVQTALAVLLLIAALLTIRSFRAVRQVQLGFEPAGVITFNVSVPSRKYVKAAVNQQFYRQALDTVRQLPGVGAVAGVSLRPFAYGAIGSGVAVVVEGEDPRAPEAWRKHPTLSAESVTTDYFRVMGISLLQGRGFLDGDDGRGPGVVIVSLSAAKHLWPGQNPIGKRVFANYDRPPGDWQTVVGVVGDARYRGLAEESLDTLYKPYRQSEDGVQHFVVRPSGPAFAFVGGLRAAIHRVDPDASVDGVEPMAAVIDREIAPWRFQTFLFSALSGLALLIAMVGLYATLAQFVAERVREIGIRLALGARRIQIVIWLARRTAKLILIAIVLGLVAAAISSRAMAALLFGIHVADPFTYVGVSAIIAVSAAAGAWLPLRRATLFDPNDALREE
jgi:putative ABC transport system permease protein